MVRRLPADSNANRSIDSRSHCSPPKGAVVVHRRIVCALLAIALVFAALLGPAPAPASAQSSRPRDFFVAAAQDLDAFWTQLFATARRSYVTPNIVRSNYLKPSRCAPGVVGPGNGPHYCDADLTIFMPIKVGNFSIKFLLENHGAVGVYYVLAHEWGHHVQRLVQGTTPSSQAKELQADCMAGLYLRSLANRGGLDLSSFQHTLHLIGTHLGRDPAGHGTSQQRYQWFYHGYSQYTLAACGL